MAGLGTGRDKPPVRAAEALLLAGLVVVSMVRFVPSGADPVPVRAEEVVHLVDVDSSPWFELIHLPGIGETRAREIVRDRARRGPFRKVSGLRRVRGIGPETVKKIEAYLAECANGRDRGREGACGPDHPGARRGPR